MDERGQGIVAWPGVPELAIGVEAAQRGRGIGAALLGTVISAAGRAGYGRLVLSVDPANPAARLYRRTGFRMVTPSDPNAGSSVLMVHDLAEGAETRSHTR